MDIKAKIDAINNWIALRITLIVGTMWCVYAFAALTVLPLFYPASTVAVQFISSAFLQLVLLPMIMVGNALLSKSSEARAAEDHDMIMAELAEVKAMHAELHLMLGNDLSNTVVEITPPSE